MADGKNYSASNPLAGMDMCLSILADLTDLKIAETMAEELGYQWDPDEEDGIYR